MRLFTGLALSPGAVSRICETLRPLKGQTRLQWSPPENLHITIKFLGNCPAEQFPAIVEAIRKVPAPGSLTVEITGIRALPSLLAPRVLYAGVRAPAALYRFAGEMDLAVSAVGIPRETRAYTPHVTLARVKPGQSIDPIRPALRQLEGAKFGSFETSDFQLYLSRPAPGGSLYEILETFPLGLQVN